MKNYVKIIITVLVSAVACYGIIFLLTYNRTHDEQRPLTISVSIPPLKYLVEQITGGQYPVNVILPAGSSPETYEPTPRQLKELEQSGLIFTTGLIDFENSVAAKVTSSGTFIIPVHKGITLIQDENHSHHHGDDHGHPHSHGVDPHIWTSTSCLKVMAANILENIPEVYYKEEFTDNCNALLAQVDKLDGDIRQMLANSGVTAFLIYHPALTYYARDYGLEQIQLEYGGKEPSAEKLIRTITLAKELNLSKVLYQKEFSLRAVETAARDAGAVAVEIDPLAEDIISNMYHITEIIAQ